jgi:hypothetical protein
MRIPAHYYQYFDADYDLDVPAEGMGGWKQAELTFDRDRTALVVMHAWDVGSRAEYPGIYRAVEYLSRDQAIVRDVFPPLLRAVRETGTKLIHVVGGRDYYSHLPGYRRAAALTPPSPVPPRITVQDPLLDAARRFKSEHAITGPRNAADRERSNAIRSFAPGTEPVGDEWIVKDTEQLFAVCEAEGINHLVYSGFAIDACLLLSPAGMVDMSRRGLMCSVLKQATTAMESKETARREWAKEVALWRVALQFGFVFDVDAFIHAIRADSRES